MPNRHPFASTGPSTLAPAGAGHALILGLNRRKAPMRFVSGLAWELLLLDILMPAQGTIEPARRKQLRTFLRVLHLHADLTRSQGTRAESEIAFRQELHERLQELAPELSALYTTLLRLRRFPLVCRLEAGTCTGCWMKVPAALVAAVRRADAVLQCPSCHRVLFSGEWLADS